MTPSKALKLKARARLRLQQQSAPAAQPPGIGPEPTALSPAGLVTNFPGSAYKVGANLVDAALHPQAAIEGLGDLAGGYLARSPIPRPGWLGDTRTPEDHAHQAETADAFDQMLEAKWSTPTRAWNTVVENPADALLTLAPGLGVAGKAASLSRLPRVAGALDKAAEFTNPVNMIKKPIVAALPAKTLRPAIRTEEALQAEKNAKYGEVKRSGMSYTDKSTSGLVDNIYRSMERDGFDLALHPKSAAMIKNLEKFRSSSPSIHELDKARQIIRRDIITPDPASADAHFGKIMINKLDKFAENSSPRMMTNSNMVKDPGKLLTDARKANVAYRKTEMINDKLDRGERQAAATGKGTNQDNALRQKVNELINEKKGQTFKTFSPAEQQQMEQNIVRGTKGRNAARKVGALAPTGIVSGGIGTSVGASAGAKIAMLLGLPPEIGAGIGAVAVPTVGQIGKTIADRGTRSAVDDLLRIIQNGGKKLPKSSRHVNDKTMIKALIAGDAAGSMTGPR